MPKRQDNPRQVRPVERALRLTFGRNLRAAREAAGLTQADLHQRLGFAQSYISQVERGVVNISLHTMSRLAALLNTTVNELLGGNKSE